MDSKQPMTAERIIAQDMRSSNYEQFKSLVRMHLSFELDLNTDEFDLPCHEVVYYEKGKVKKWNRLSKKMKGCTAGVKTNSPPETNTISLTTDLIEQLRVLKQFLLNKENVIQEGIFRRTGAVSRQNELRLIINQRKEINLSKGYTVHDCATVYKGCLADLPEPLLTDAHYPAHCQIADLCNAESKVNCKVKEDHLLHSVQLLLLLLPDQNRILLEDVVDMLHETVKYQISNKMTPDTLATLFAPHLICPRNLPAEALHYVSQNMSSVISYMIVKGPHIFDIPPKLATDIRAYSLEQKRKKTMSPEQILDESVSDISTVNTVYTFVDREKTAEAHNSNPTDTALAQLYAHIQSMPESSKKRKLIKQFNKENGQGTPLQFLMLNRIKNAGSGRSAKSIGDSIKKHIFHRSIMSRTPKRSITTSQCDTPNSAINAPKVRVLFQSPNPNLSTLGPSLATKKHPLHKSISSSSLLTATVTSAVQKEASVLDVMKSKWKPTQINESVRVEENNQQEIIMPGRDVRNAVFDRADLFHGNRCSQHNRDVDSKTLSVAKNNTLFKSKSDTDIISFSCNNHDEQKVELRSTLKKSVSLSVLNDCCLLDAQDSWVNGKAGSGLSIVKGLSNANIEDPVPEPVSLVSYMNPEAACTPRGIKLCRSKELITSTPSVLLGRRSMSPITKSTQRMPKSMQESIMTPRSRKPVMLATTIGLLDQNQATYQGDLSSFREQDEDSFLGNNTSTQVEPSTRYRSFSENDLDSDAFDRKFDSQPKCVSTSESLTNTFREYLLSRSVLTTSPVDTSFSSHSDDFGSTPDIRDLDESEMSASLLYCLDGNQPDSSLSEISMKNDTSNLRIDESSDKGNFSRKRSASIERQLEEKENIYSNEISPTHAKKVFIAAKNPNETSL